MPPAFWGSLIFGTGNVAGASPDLVVLSTVGASTVLGFERLEAILCVCRLVKTPFAVHERGHMSNYPIPSEPFQAHFSD